jgi:hypothetical protein
MPGETVIDGEIVALDEFGKTVTIEESDVLHLIPSKYFYAPEKCDAFRRGTD